MVDRSPSSGRNSTIRLSIVRSQIDQQQQVIALLENRLQESILGGTDAGNINFDQTLPGILGEIADIYGDAGVPGSTDPAKQFDGLTGAIAKGVADFDIYDNTKSLEQDVLRQLLYQARALLGELRVEEQHWNGEVSEEKSRRKDLGELTKG
ncbi:MAG: hypothetical protein LW817_07685 [Candidatus Caenarcaniphilales bacterium]|jgi:hypothetical protein|nr:hypothetical protein [Candidatus Caenarcaniphilales bacterium]